MALARKHLGRAHAMALLLAAALIVALPAPGVTLADVSPTITSRYTYTQPKFPKPASERVQPDAGATSVKPTGAAIPPTATTNTLPRASTTPVITTPTITSATPAPTTNSTPVGAARPTAGSSGPSTPAIVAAVIAALLALGCGVWGVARLQAYEPRWTLSMRHSVAEARFRASATWAEFSDWAKLGR
jgi:hypothetical protein